jgi:ribosomal protein S1
VTRTSLRPGDEVDAVVTTVTPFGVFVRTEAGVPGLVRAARDEVGMRLHLRVIEFDPDERRFSAAVV